MKKEGTVFPWVGNGKSISTALRIFLALAAILIPSFVFFGNNYWFPKERGESLEKKQMVLEHKIETQHELQLLKHENTVEKIDDIHTDFRELKQMIKDHFPHSNPTRQ